MNGNCCNGLNTLASLPRANRPGLAALNYRVGTHAAFLDAMLARLSSQDLPALAALRTRDPHDPAIALLDAWATVADVLSFYQERIANEGYLRTATERRSLVELARLVDYRLRPGVAASAYLAFTMEPGFNKNAKVPSSTRVQSVPAPGEMPQTFETEQDIEARTDWNHLQPRLTRPQFITFHTAEQQTRLFFADTTTQLQANDPLLLVFGDGEAEQVLRRVKSVAPDLERKQTQVELFLASDAIGAVGGVVGVGAGAIADSTATEAGVSSTSVANSVRSISQVPKASQSVALQSLSGAIKTLAKPPSLPPVNSQQLKRSKAQAFDPAIDIAPQLLVNLKREIETSFYPAWSNTQVPVEPVLDSVKSIEKFGVKASPFGHNAPLKPVYEDNQGHPIRYEEWPLSDPMTVGINLFTIGSEPQLGIALNALALAAAEEARLQAAITVATGSTSQTVELSVTEEPVEIQVKDQTVRVSLSTSSPSTSSSTVFVRSAANRSARIRFVHALSGEGPVDVYTIDAENNPTILFENIQPFQATEYISLTSTELNQLRLAVRPAGQTEGNFLINQTVNSWGSERAYSIYLLKRESGNNPSGQFELFYTQADDPIAPSGDSVRVKVINASHHSSGIEVTIDDQMLIQATSEPSAISFTNQAELVASAPHVITVTSTATGQVLLSSTDLQLRADKVHSIVLIGGDSDDNPLRFFVVEADTTLPGEQARITFDFLDLGRSYRVIFTNNNGDDFRTFIQVANGQALTIELGPNTSHQLASDNQKITIEGSLFNPEAPLQIQEETYEPVVPAFRRVVALDAQYDQILPGSWVVINHPQRQIISQVREVKTISKAEYGITGKVTQLTLDRAWLETSDRTLATLRETTIYAQSEPLALAEEVLDPIQYAIGGEDPETSTSFEIELADLYDGLKPGQWLIVSGERADILNAEGITEGVKASELVMLAGVRQGVAQVPLFPVSDVAPEGGSGSSDIPGSDNDVVLIDLPSDRTHSFLQLAQPLAYKYKRDTVTIYGNVVKATHGETRREVLGSGDGSKTLQRFGLSKSPLTHLSAPTRSGTESTLVVRVNDVEWHEVDTLAQAGANEHSFVTYTDDDDKTHIIFGDGTQGARLPSGIENVTAVYRDGMGKDGNVKADQLKLLATRPLGVKGVINPLPATGGASRETVLDAKQNVPLAVMALDRLVSVQDYADFVRTYVGIAKADVQQLTDGRRQLIHLTIAGVDDIPISENSDLYRNLGRSLKRFGDPHQPVQVDVRELMLLIMSARIQILPDYLWESVKVAVEAALFEEFSFERRHLGQDVLLSEVISTIHRVPGVAYVDVDVLDSVSESEAEDPSQLTEKLLQLAQSDTIPVTPQPAGQTDAAPDTRVGAVLGAASGSTPDAPERRRSEFATEPKASSASIPQPRQRIPVRLARVMSDATGTIQPAQLAILSPELPETLKLEEITP